MDLVDLLRMALRRWYVTVPVLVLTFGVAAAIQMNSPREYEASGTLLMAAPELDPSRAPQIAVELDAAITDLTTQRAMAEIERAGGSDGFTIRQIDGQRAEVVVVGVDERAERTAQLVMDRLADAVLQSQVAAEVPEDERVTPRSQIESIVPTDLEEAEDPDTSDGTAEGDGSDEPDTADVSDGSQPRTLGSLYLADPAAARSNPYAANDSTGRLLQESIQSDAGRLFVMEQVGSTDFLGFSVSPQGGPGIISVTTYATDPATTLEAFQTVHEVLAMELDRRQERAQVPTTRRLVLEPLAAPQAPVDVTPPIDRAVAAIVGLGGLLAVGLVLLIENLAGRHARRASREFPATSGPWPTVDHAWLAPHDDGGSGTSAPTGPSDGALEPDPPYRT